MAPQAWYTEAMIRNLMAWTIVMAPLTSLAAQGVRSPKAPRLAYALPAGPAGAAQLNNLFDASAARADIAVMAGGYRPASRPLTAPPAPATNLRPTPSRLHQDLVVPIPRETPAYRRTFKAMLTQTKTTDRWDELIIKYARKYRLDARLLKSIMAAESEFNPKAVSPAGARGLMQVMPVTALGVGVAANRLHDPESGIKAGAAYVQVLFKTAWRLFRLKGVRYTDVPHWVMQRVVAAYHAGPKFLTRKSWFASTKAYVRKVVLFYHSKVTDLRRPNSAAFAENTSFSEGIAPSGSMY